MTGRPAEVNTTHLRQAVKELGFELASLVGGYDLRTAKASNQARQQGKWHCLCSDVRNWKGFRPAREKFHSGEAVLKSCRGR